MKFPYTISHLKLTKKMCFNTKIGWLNYLLIEFYLTLKLLVFIKPELGIKNRFLKRCKMQKIELRKTFRNKRKNLSFNTIQNQSLKISNNILQMKIWDFLYYHVFITITEKKEVDTSYLITLLQGKDKNIIVPKTVSENQLENYLLTDNTLFKKNKWNIPEPVEGILINEKQLDVVFIPLLAFDKKGNRVGYGKGFYDTFLKKCNADVLKIGLSFFDSVEHIKNTSQNDIPLDYCVTPDKVYSF